VAVREILEYPDPRLRLASGPVTDFGGDLADLVDDLIETLHAHPAIGLSAPQADDQRQVLVMDLSADKTAPEVYVNPEIVASARPGFVEESCLSVPGVAVNVLRATRVRVRALDPEGVAFERELADMHAVCLQHEMDHFDGKLLADRLNWFRRMRLDRAIARVRRTAGREGAVA
jgi:peptide deformylase